LENVKAIQIFNVKDLKGISQFRESIIGADVFVGEEISNILELNKLVNLKYLQFYCDYSCDYMEVIDFRDFKYVTHLPTFITSPDYDLKTFTHLTNVEKIGFIDSNITGIEENLKSFINLRDLTIGWHKYNFLDILSLKKLEYLELDSLTQQEIKLLAQLPELRALSVYNIKNINIFSTFPKLEVVYSPSLKIPKKPIFNRNGEAIFFNNSNIGVID
jgi:hypothetical protein